MQTSVLAVERTFLLRATRIPGQAAEGATNIQQTERFGVTVRTRMRTFLVGRELSRGRMLLLAVRLQLERAAPSPQDLPRAACTGALVPGGTLDTLMSRQQKLASMRASTRSASQARRYAARSTGAPSGTSVADLPHMNDYTPDYGRRIVVDLEFEAAVGEVNRALREEGLCALAQIDVRNHFSRDPGHLFRQYLIIEAWSPDLAVKTLDRHLDAGLMLPTRIVLYELADGETAVLTSEPLSPLASHARWREDFPGLADIADAESERLARVLEGLQDSARRSFRGAQHPPRDALKSRSPLPKRNDDHMRDGGPRSRPSQRRLP